jgi:hypothetical protein
MLDFHCLSHHRHDGHSKVLRKFYQTSRLHVPEVSYLHVHQPLALRLFVMPAVPTSCCHLMSALDYSSLVL